MLEQLAIRDVFGCMTTQLPPSILNIAFSPWFFEAEQWSYGDDEWESVERMFGESAFLPCFVLTIEASHEGSSMSLRG